MKLSTATKIFLVFVCMAISIFGFMLKLPSVFRHSDKALHALFYFVAAAFLNILFARRNIGTHLFIFGILYLFGVAIEHAQAYSNQFFRVRIHGRYDPEDVRSNLKGLITFSVLWFTYIGLAFAWSRIRYKQPIKSQEL